MQFTKEQLSAKAREQIAFCRHTKITGEGRTHVNQCSALFEIALAALTAPTEPVYQYRIRNGYNGQVTEWQTIRRDQVDFVLKSQPHNAEFQIIARPAPVVPEEWQQWIVDAAEYLEGGLEADGELEAEGSIEAKRLLSRRAAMLQGAEPVSTDYTLPADVRGAINRLLDSDGSRGTFSAVRSYDAREELERLLAAAPQQEVSR